MAGYRLSPAAEADLYRIWLYGVEQWGVLEADRYYAALFQRFDQIAANPLQYPAVDDVREGYRRSVHGRDSIYYRCEGDLVEIMAIIGQQDLNEWL
jgi:toxin ParE1/3/4